MTSTLRASARDVRREQAETRSKMARQMFTDLMQVPRDQRRVIFREAPGDVRREIMRAAQSEAGTPLAMYVDDPAGFVEDVLDETLWSKSREVLQSVADNKITAVPSCFSSSKTWGAARADVWWTQVHAPGTALAITMAPLWRQVVRQMWPEIRKAHNRANLPGTVDTYQMKQTTYETKLQVVTSYGLVANKNDESAGQGIHSPALLIIVDEAGGIPANVGKNLRALLTGGAKMLAIGNPPTDDEGGWFDTLCTKRSTDRGVNVITISAFSTPGLTGEVAARCKSCPAGVPAHDLATHLVDEEWVDDTIAEFGEESPWVQSKVYARFPRGVGDRVLPYSWVERAKAALEPEHDDYVTLRSLGFVDGEVDPDYKVRMGAWVRLGVDVAAGGGDELVIARSAGDLLTIQHASSGEQNGDATVVAGKILHEIQRATALAESVGSTAPVRVKIDAIGVGWGVAGELETMKVRGLHNADIVKIVVSEGTGREPAPRATFRPRIKRDEMWVGFRDLLPRPSDADAIIDTTLDPEDQLATAEPVLPRIRLRVDGKTIAQLTAPTVKTRPSDGLTVVESKDSMRARGVNSPDRAEAVILSTYEPAPAKPKRRKARLISS